MIACDNSEQVCNLGLWFQWQLLKFRNLAWIITTNKICLRDPLQLALRSTRGWLVHMKPCAATATNDATTLEVRKCFCQCVLPSTMCYIGMFCFEAQCAVVLL